MLKIVVPSRDIFDDKTQTFTTFPSFELVMEHSLDSLSQWEMKYTKPFISQKDKTLEEWMYYFKCMTLNGDRPIEDYYLLTAENIDAIRNYIALPMSAYHPPKSKGKSKHEIVTAENFYYCMMGNNIPMECSKWHLNRLRALIDMFSANTAKPEKMSKSELYAKHRAINEANRLKYHTKG